MKKTFKINTKYDKNKYTKYAKNSAKVVYWLALLVIVVLNFLIFLILLPIIQIIQNIQLYVIVGSIGLVFGLILNFLIRDIDHLEPKHHIFAVLFIPIISIINMALLLSFYQTINSTVTGNNMGFVVAGVIYVLMCALPYVLSLLKKKH